MWKHRLLVLYCILDLKWAPKSTSILSEVSLGISNAICFVLSYTFACSYSYKTFLFVFFVVCLLFSYVSICLIVFLRPDQRMYHRLPWKVTISLSQSLVCDLLYAPAHQFPFCHLTYGLLKYLLHILCLWISVLTMLCLRNTLCVLYFLNFISINVIAQNGIYLNE